MSRLGIHRGTSTLENITEQPVEMERHVLLHGLLRCSISAKEMGTSGLSVEVQLCPTSWWRPTWSQTVQTGGLDSDDSPDGIKTQYFLCSPWTELGHGNTRRQRTQTLFWTAGCSLGHPSRCKLLTEACFLRTRLNHHTSPFSWSRKYSL